MASFSSELQAMADNMEEIKKQNSSLIQKMSAMEITMQEVERENRSLRDKQANTEKKLSAMEIAMEEVKKENGSLRNKQAEIEKDHVKRIQKLESDHLMMAQIKRVWGRSLVQAQEEAEMKNKLSDRESTTGATASARATAPTGATAKSGTGGDGGKDTQLTPPSRQQPRPLRTKEEIKNIKHQSQFSVYKSPSSPAFRVPRGRTPTPIEGYDYDETWIHSPYIDVTTGIYTVPLKGKCRFRVGDYGVEGTESLGLFLCRGDGRRKRMTGRRKWFDVWCLYDCVEWECEEGDKVWVEGMWVGGDVMVEGFGFIGRVLG